MRFEPFIWERTGSTFEGVAGPVCAVDFVSFNPHYEGGGHDLRNTTANGGTRVGIAADDVLGLDRAEDHAAGIHPEASANASQPNTTTE